MQNYMIGALRGTPSGGGWLGRFLRKRGTRLPMIMPMGARYMKKKMQFVHVDDVARLMAWLLRQGPAGAGITILNVAGRGEAVSAEECFRIANAKCSRLPGKYACKFVLQMLWALGISGVPPEALPYIVGSYTMDIRRLQQLLGKDFEDVMRHTVRSALADSFKNSATAAVAR
jgi:nucleoside-diphosphate-sugar epimerase